MADTEHGKIAEQRIRTWLDRPDQGYSFDRIPDQMSGYFMVSRNICDFICYRYPYMFYIESKATTHDRFEFSIADLAQKSCGDVGIEFDEGFCRQILG